MYVCVQKGTSASMLSRISLEKSHALINVVRSVRYKGIKVLYALHIHRTIYN